MALIRKDRNMFDYLKIEKHLTECENLFFENLQSKGTYADGTECFFIFNGFKPLKVLWSKRMNRLTIFGSFPFFWQGHNFTFPMQAFYNAVESIETKIRVNLLDADVIKFESCRVVEVERPPNEILNKHRDLKGFERIEFKRGVYFESKILKVKLYDAGHRIKTVSRPCINTLKNDLGFKSDTNYIRIENHYKKPQIHFKERNIKLETLFSESFQTIVKKDLLETYQAIEKMKPLAIPTDKKLITSSTIPILCLQELSEKYGFDAQQEISNFLKSISKEVLPQNDRKQRKRQIKENFEKLASCGVETTYYDLTSKLD